MFLMFVIYCPHLSWSLWKPVVKIYCYSAPSISVMQIYSFYTVNPMGTVLALWVICNKKCSFASIVPNFERSDWSILTLHVENAPLCRNHRWSQPAGCGTPSDTIAGLQYSCWQSYLGNKRNCLKLNLYFQTYLSCNLDPYLREINGFSVVRHRACSRVTVR
jgi:hypothetical protein